MSTYKQIHGTNIDVLSSDPANPVEGQVWYNSTSNTVKAFFDNPGSWATGGDLNTARNQLAGAGADNTNALAFGGNPNLSVTESYDGTSWTEVNDLNTGREHLAGAGADNTAALAFGGYPKQALTESWNGTNWTEVNDMNTGKQYLGAGGTQTSALAFGGEDPSPLTVGVLTESWNGTSWTEV